MNVRSQTAFWRQKIINIRAAAVMSPICNCAVFETVCTGLSNIYFYVCIIIVHNIRLYIVYDGFNERFKRL
jgi:hypothetical protein